jgi:hypothetical protein
MEFHVSGLKDNYLVTHSVTWVTLSHEWDDRQHIVIQKSNPNKVHRHHFVIEHSTLNKNCKAFDAQPQVHVHMHTKLDLRTRFIHTYWHSS